MKRVKLIVAYDGTNYCGWQVQPNGITIEQVLNENLSKLLGALRTLADVGGGVSSPAQQGHGAALPAFAQL